MNRDDPSPTTPPPPRTEEYVQGWYTTYNEDGGFPNGYDDGEGAQVFVLESTDSEDAWIAVPQGIELELAAWC